MREHYILNILLPQHTLITTIILRYLLQGIAEIGTGVGYACGPVIGGFLYKVLGEIVAISGILRHEGM